MPANFNPHIKDHQMALVSHQFFPVGIYNQVELGRHQGEVVVIKPRRRRKKNKGEGGSSGLRLKKRKLSQDQVNLLELNFGSEHKLESERKDRLASELGLDPRQVAVWFQNRRARWKSKKLEEEYSKLKAEHEATIVLKCRLETEVIKLKEQLSEAEKEKQRLLELIRCDGVSTNSPMSSSLSVEAMHPPFLGEFGMQGLENIFCVPENSYINGMEWVNLI